MNRGGSCPEIGEIMIDRGEILSLEYLKKTEFTGSHQGMRYRLEKIKGEGEGEEETRLKVTVWPEPFNFFNTPDDEKQTEVFEFNEDGVQDAVGWMNDRLFQDKAKWDRAGENWDNYTFG